MGKREYALAIGVPGVISAASPRQRPNRTIHVVDGESIGIDWDHEPTQEDEDAMDAAIAAGDYAAWQAAHGGDAALTSRREAKEALDKATSRMESLIRAFALVVLDEFNTLRDQHGLAARTAAQLRSAIKGKLDAGDADS